MIRLSGQDRERLEAIRNNTDDRHVYQQHHAVGVAAACVEAQYQMLDHERRGLEPVEQFRFGLDVIGLGKLNASGAHLCER